MQSNAAKAVVAIVSIAVIVALGIALAGGDDESEPTGAATATSPTTTTGGQSGEPEIPPKPDKPELTRIVVEGGEPKGGVRELQLNKGERVRLEVVSDVAEHVHVHGYDLFEDVTPDSKARFSFDADIEGVFEIELEDSHVQIAQLTVRP